MKETVHFVQQNIAISSLSKLLKTTTSDTNKPHRCRKVAAGLLQFILIDIT
jgi:hypothetical protein